MSGNDPHILVVGGHSRIAITLAPLLGDIAAYVVRRPIGRPCEVIVDDYRDIPTTAFAGMRVVINCVGTSTGSVAHLDRINVDVPRRLAIAAKAAGVRRLIHISSFSVYGGASVINRETPAAPANDYGRSKLAADEALQTLAEESFAVTLLRLPLIYGEESLGKLGQLLRLWRRIRVFPVPAGDISRAMIGVELSAEVVARLTAEPQTDCPAKIVFAADPQAFTYAAAAHARKERLYRLTIPRKFTRFAERLAPAIGERLFGDSHLAKEDNLAVGYGLHSRLYHDIAAVDLG